MTESGTTRIIVWGFFALFFLYLFGPLIIMVGTAFNSSSFPRLDPWECLTFRWFGQLADDRALLEGLRNSLLIGAGVVFTAVPIGLAAALALSQAGPRIRPVLYTVFISPILMPGVVLGISTLIFWDRTAKSLGASYDSIFYSGFFLTVLGQVTFIAAYSMLVFIARLQRFDMTQMEAALDLGATPGQAFRKVLLPFLRPAIGAAGVLAFLSSLENYNTTTFTISSESTFTTVLAGKVRLGIDPSISAVAVIIIGLTVIGALVHEAHKRREAVLLRGEAGRRLPVRGNPAYRFIAHPATLAVMLFAAVGVMIALASQHSSAVCEDTINAEKRARAEEARRQMEERRALQNQGSQTQPGGTPATAPDSSTNRPGFGGGAFAPGNLGTTAPAPAPAPAPDSSGNRPAFGGGAFAPGNLGPATPSPEPAPEAAPEPAPAPAPTPVPDSSTNRPAFGGGAFAPGNLGPAAPAPAPQQPAN